MKNRLKRWSPAFWVWPLVLTFSSSQSLFAAEIGKSLQEITQLANKEKVVRMASALEPDAEKIVLSGFHQKYPGVKVEHTRISGAGSREKILSEGLGGLYEFDIADISSELQEKFIKAKVVAGPIEWRKLFPQVPEVHFSPNGYFVAVGFSTHGIAYNPALVSRESVPKKWEDCLDPRWKGKFVVDTRPKTLAGLYRGWGEAKVLEYAAQLKNNQPIWKRGQTETLTQLASGEYPMLCGAYYQSVDRILRRDPKAKIAISLPTEVPVSMGESLAVLKGAKSPNAAVLLAGWLSTTEGQRAYDQVGRGSAFVEGTEVAKLVQKAGAKVIFGGWDEFEYEPAITKKILAVWGFK